MNRLLALALAALVLAVSAGRAVRLARGADPFGARGETRWLSWAYRGADLGERFARAGARLAPGELVYVLTPPGLYETGWLRVMAAYYLPRQTVVRVDEGDARSAPPRLPPGAAVVEFGAGGEVEVERIGGGGWRR